MEDVRSELAMDSESEESESATPTNADTAKTETEPFPDGRSSIAKMRWKLSYMRERRGKKRGGERGVVRMRLSSRACPL
jgi:hypothetical protein